MQHFTLSEQTRGTRCEAAATAPEPRLKHDGRQDGQHENVLLKSDELQWGKHKRREAKKGKKLNPGSQSNGSTPYWHCPPTLQWAPPYGTAHSAAMTSCLRVSAMGADEWRQHNQTNHYAQQQGDARLADPVDAAPAGGVAQRQRGNHQHDLGGHGDGGVGVVSMHCICCHMQEMRHDARRAWQRRRPTAPG